MGVKAALYLSKLREEAFFMFLLLVLMPFASWAELAKIT